MADILCPLTVISASTVGLPLESRTSLAHTFSICIFNPLTDDDMVKIAKILISNINKRLKDKGLSLKITENALEFIVSKGKVEGFGARPLKRYLEQQVEDRIAEKILLGELSKKGVIIIDCDEKDLTFTSEDD